MSDYTLVDDVKKFFTTLKESDKIDKLQEICHDHNLDFKNSRVLRLQAVPRQTTRNRKSYLICSCGHDYNCHALDEIWEDGSCRMHNCECGRFEG
jgi:hypothetical protein